jgi:hypothetical protein
MKLIKKVEHEEIDGYVCDVCGKTITDFEMGDVVSVDTVGGYDSVFGDGSKIQIDICGSCFKAKLGEFIHVTEPEWPQ